MKKNWIMTMTLAACFGGAAARGAEMNNAIYLLGAFDGKMLTNQDANNYFNLNDQLGPQGYPSWGGHLGVQIMRWLALEASYQYGPLRENDIYYENGPFTTRHVKTRWELNTYSLTPAVTWVGDGYVNFLGLRVGQANLMGKVNDDAFGTNGSYEQSAQTYDIGVVLRTSHIMFNHLSVGLEAGYDWTMFNNITDKNGSGTYNPPHSPERNISTFGHNGDQTTLDFSGAHIAIVVGLWSNAPYVSDGGSDMAGE